MKEFKWCPGIFQKRLEHLRMVSQFYDVVHDERFHRTFKRLILFANLEVFDIQPPCHWSYGLVPEEIKIELMNTECPCGINTDEIHYMDMSELEFNEKQQVVFTTDHDVDFGFGGFHEIEMWTYSEEKHIHQLAEQMKNSTEKEKISIQAQIVKFIADTMAAYEQEVLAFQRSMIREAQLSVSNQESIEESIPLQNTSNDIDVFSGILDELPLFILVCLYLLLLLIYGICYIISGIHYIICLLIFSIQICINLFLLFIFGISSSLVYIWHQEPLVLRTSKAKTISTSRQKRLQADAIQAAKDVEEAKLKQLENKKHEYIRTNGTKQKKIAKTHFRKSQKPARL